MWLNTYNVFEDKMVQIQVKCLKKESNQLGIDKSRHFSVDPRWKEHLKSDMREDADLLQRLSP